MPFDIHIIQYIDYHNTGYIPLSLWKATYQYTDKLIQTGSLGLINFECLAMKTVIF